MPSPRRMKRLGFVQTLDTKPKRRLYEVLQSQGLQMNQEITFLSDGDDTLRKLQLEMSPMATHLLDWFHLTMRLTVLDQYGKGLVQGEAGLGEAIRDKIERLKWSLWHGQVDKALGKIDDLESAIAPFSETYARFPKLVKALSALRTYIVNSATRPCGSKGIGAGNDSMKLCVSSSRCDSCPAKGEPARAGSKPCDGVRNGLGEA